MSSIASIFPDEVIRAFAWTLIHSLWQGAIIALLAAGSVIFLRKHRPEIRYAMLCLLLALFPVMFAGTFIYYYQAKNTPDLNAALVQGKSDVYADELNTPSAIRINEASKWYSLPAELIEDQADIMVLIWLLGFFFFVFRFAGSMIYVHRLKSTGLLPLAEIWEQKLSELSTKLELKKKIRLAESLLAKIPLTVGYLKPVILLPIGTLSSVPPQQLEAILLHELAHIRRKDYLINVLQSVVEMFFFYHPAAWWLSRLIREEREHICDDMVVRINEDHINYIKALTTMEELNSKSPMLAHAVTGSRKRLLSRVKRLVNPGKFRKGFGEGIIIVLIVIGVVSAFSMNALSIIPNSYDLTGRESGEKVFNFLPTNHESLNLNSPKEEFVAVPDTVVASSKSGKVVVTVYTDSTDADDQKHLQVFVENLDNQVGKWENANDEYKKEVIILKKNSEELDSLRKIIIVRGGDSIKIIKNDTVLVFPQDYDTSITTDNGFMYYEFEVPELQNIPEISDIPELQYFYFDEAQRDAEKEMERAFREQEFSVRDLERMQRDLERQQKEYQIEIQENTGVNPGHENFNKEWKWTQMNPEPKIKESERIIRQELRDNGLTFKGRSYVIELDNKAMYINGDKMPKETYKKYRKLVESLEQVDFENGGRYKLIF